MIILSELPNEKKTIYLNAQVFQILVRMITILKIVFVINKVSSKLFFL